MRSSSGSRPLSSSILAGPLEASFGVDTGLACPALGEGSAPGVGVGVGVGSCRLQPGWVCWLGGMPHGGAGLRGLAWSKKGPECAGKCRGSVSREGRGDLQGSMAGVSSEQAEVAEGRLPEQAFASPPPHPPTPTWLLPVPLPHLWPHTPGWDRGVAGCSEVGFAGWRSCLLRATPQVRTVHQGSCMWLPKASWVAPLMIWGQAMAWPPLHCLCITKSPHPEDFLRCPCTAACSWG